MVPDINDCNTESINHMLLQQAQHLATSVNMLDAKRQLLFDLFRIT